MMGITINLTQFVVALLLVPVGLLLVGARRRLAVKVVVLREGC
jgi:hypothetical protein